MHKQTVLVVTCLLSNEMIFMGQLLVDNILRYHLTLEVYVGTGI